MIDTERMNATDDASLVARCLNHETAAWQTLVDRYERLVYAILRRMEIDEHTGADVFQTVFSRLFEHLSRIDDPTRLQAWIVTTTKREGLLQRERARRNVSLTPVDGEDEEWIVDIEDEAAQPDEALEKLQLANMVRNAVESMDDRCRELLTLLYRDDDSVPYDEIAERLGIPLGSIGPTRARCLAKLRSIVEAR
jgi:RNA polymerase sigma factor (sigma-70 family)